LVGGTAGFIKAAGAHEGLQAGLWFAVMFLAILGLAGFTVVNPNEARVVTLFGRYTGSLRDAGLWWVNPFTARKRVSLRVRNFESAKLKVNDHDRHPIQTRAVS